MFPRTAATFYRFMPTFKRVLAVRKVVRCQTLFVVY